MPKKKKKSSVPEVSISNRKSVDIKKADNGYVVSTWDLNKEKIYIAKSKKEAMKYASKILKGV